MGQVDNPFIGYTSAELTTLRAQLKTAISDILKVGKSYTFPGRTHTKADLSDLMQMQRYANAAWDALSGVGGKTIVQARVNTTGTCGGRSDGSVVDRWD